MISDDALAALRCAAAVVAALPSVRVRVGHGERTLLEVARPPFPARGEHPVLPVCHFRAAVARATAQRRAGHELRFLDLDEGNQPSVAYGVDRGDLALTGGLVRVALDGAWLHAVAVTGRVPDVGRLTDGPETTIRAHRDDDLDTTLLHVATEPGDQASSVAAVDALVTALGRRAADEIELLLV